MISSTSTTHSWGAIALDQSILHKTKASWCRSSSCLRRPSIPALRYACLCRLISCIYICFIRSWTVCFVASPSSPLVQVLPLFSAACTTLDSAFYPVHMGVNQVHVGQRQPIGGVARQHFQQQPSCPWVGLCRRLVLCVVAPDVVAIARLGPVVVRLCISAIPRP